MESGWCKDKGETFTERMWSRIKLEIAVWRTRYHVQHLGKVQKCSRMSTDKKRKYQKKVLTLLKRETLACTGVHIHPHDQTDKSTHHCSPLSPPTQSPRSVCVSVCADMQEQQRTYTRTGTRVWCMTVREAQHKELQRDTGHMTRVRVPERKRVRASARWFARVKMWQNVEKPYKRASKRCGCRTHLLYEPFGGTLMPHTHTHTLPVLLITFNGTITYWL